MILNYLWVGLGGALGSMARFWVSGWCARHVAEAFPFGTLFVNVTGSFVIGFIAAVVGLEGGWAVGPGGRAFFMAGLCGGYTTFSSFSLETLRLARDGQWLHAGANASASLICCLVAVWLGHVLGMNVRGQPK